MARESGGGLSADPYQRAQDRTDRVERLVDAVAGLKDAASDQQPAVTVVFWVGGRGQVGQCATLIAQLKTDKDMSIRRTKNTTGPASKDLPITDCDPMAFCPELSV